MNQAQLFVRIKPKVKRMSERTFPVITLCGSSKQKDDFMYWQRELALKGNVVIPINVFLGLEKADYNVEDETKKLLCDIHFQKIRMADKVYFIKKPDGTFGDHTNREIVYALHQDKEIFFLDSISNRNKSIKKE
jgi:hypothetical protein